MASKVTKNSNESFVKDVRNEEDWHELCQYQVTKLLSEINIINYNGRFFDIKSINKLGLSWAKLRSVWLSLWFVHLLVPLYECRKTNLDLFKNSF